ncbi:N-acetyltransferase [Paenibacillus thiaminolyticus]|uniref:N-acetyltransferase n=1 Tax=Paenibacillus thiaminolyticus TaxID=49283 RepID=UPI0025439562|nr:N-acetyltransferase [Paenibacillus thiaminolyticus]WII37586.1 N-acetyltransferase [Paenibacillus thiaminolyticus]
MEGYIQHKLFSEIDLTDPFFDSLKEDYPGFENWFARKVQEKAHVLCNPQRKLEAFLYLKVENGPIEDVTPPIPANHVLKIGTMKVNPHGTRLGERFIKRALDIAVSEGVEGIYVTVFSKHEVLVNLFVKYGFYQRAIKTSASGVELVLWKSLTETRGTALLDYPRISQRGKKKHILSIYPDFHTRLFPDSILRNERFDILEDVSHTNSIHKVFISAAPVSGLRPGDIIVIYRTTDRPGLAKYRSVATSICVVEEVKSKQSFRDVESFIDYCDKYSVYTSEELQGIYVERKRHHVIKMVYNIALRKRLTRGQLIEQLGIESARWTFFELTDNQFDSILQAGDAHESLVID